MRQKIKITGLKIFANHGVFDFERKNGQEFIVDATVWVDASDAVAKDDIAATVNYGALADALVADAAANPVDLIETLAWRLLRLTLAFANPAGEKTANPAKNPIVKAEITVHKPNAPINHAFEDVSVTVKGRRK